MTKKGRPPMFTRAIGDIICQQLALGKSLRQTCRENPLLPNQSTIRGWITANLSPAFSAQYARSRDVGAEVLFEQILDDIDDVELKPEAIMKERLRFDARRWCLSKMLPKKFGNDVSENTDKINPGLQMLIDCIRAGPATEPIKPSEAKFTEGKT